jgi:hypothetical protein
MWIREPANRQVLLRVRLTAGCELEWRHIPQLCAGRHIDPGRE